MPKATKQSTYPRRSLPRRVSDAEARAKYRKDVLNLPGPIDTWIAASVASGGGADTRCPLAPDEVRCVVQMQRREASDGAGGFGGGDIFALYLTVAGPSRTTGPHALQSSRRIVLDKYEGWCDSLDAPDWAKWTPGHTVVFRQRRSKVADVVRALLWEDVVAPLTDALNTIHL